MAACIGQRKKEKNSTDTSSMESASIGSNGTTMKGISNTNNPSGATTKKRISRLKPPTKITHTTETTTTKTTTMTTPRKTAISSPPLRSSVDRQSTQPNIRKPRTPLNNQHVNNVSPRQRKPLSPQTSPPRQTNRKSIPTTTTIAAAAVGTRRLTQPRQTNAPHKNTTAPLNTKKSPTAQMRQDFDVLKSKNAANEELIAKQLAELEFLKQQLKNVYPPTSPVPPSLSDQPTPPISQSNTMADLHQSQLSLDKDDELQQKDKALAELRQKLDQVTKDMEIAAAAANNDRVVIPSSMDDQDDDDEKRLVLEQMDKLRSENEEATRRLAIKEKELDDLRSSLQDGINTPFSNSSNGSIISEDTDELNHNNTLLELRKQLDEQKRLHGESLRQHELAISEKEYMLKAQEEALEQLKSTHTETIRQLKTQQTSNILKMKQHHKQDLIELEQKLEQVERSKQEQDDHGDQAKRQMDDELEKILLAFEQTEHNHTAQLQTMEQSHQTALSDLQQSHADQLQLATSQGYTLKKYVPSEAVSWPAPQPLSMLRKTTGPSPRPNRVLLNTTASTSEPILTPLDTKKVQVYISTVSGNPMIKKNQERIQQILKSRNISFDLVDVAASEMALQYMKRSNNNGSVEGRAKEVPQLFVGGEFRGLFNDIAKCDEDGTLDTLLVPATERKWTAAERHAIEKATIVSSSSLSSLGNTTVSPPPIRVLPSGPVATPRLRQTKTKTVTVQVDDEDEALFKELEQELGQGNVDLSELDNI